VGVNAAKLQIYTGINDVVHASADAEVNVLESLVKDSTLEIVEVPPGHVLLVCGTCFHGGCKNEPADSNNKGRAKNKPAYGYIRLHGYITTPAFHIGEEELEQGWYSYYVDKVTRRNV
jgi:hypothetical protein